MLIVFSGLPGTGKTTLARAIADRRSAVYLRVDTIEETLLLDGGESLVDLGAGYRVAYAIAEDNLRLGRTVIADCVNPIALTRKAWHDVGKRSNTMVVDVAVVCFDPEQHKLRIDGRPAGGRASNWLDVVNREFDPVDEAAIVVDTTGRSVDQCIVLLQAALIARSNSDQP